MVKHTQTIRRLLPTKCLSVLDHFVELAFKGLKGQILLSKVVLLCVWKLIRVKENKKYN